MTRIWDASGERLAETVHAVVGENGKKASPRENEHRVTPSGGNNGNNGERCRYLVVETGTAGSVAAALFKRLNGSSAASTAGS